MPLTRSRENLDNIEQPQNVSFTVDLEPSDVTPTLQGKQKRRPTNRMNDSRVVPDNSQIRKMISESLNSFREEMTNFVTIELSIMIGNINRPTNVANNNGNDNYRTSPSSDPHIHQTTFHAEKVLNIMKNWRLKYTDHDNHLPVDEFIYRVNILTTKNLGGDFELLCRHEHSLFDGKALEWYWRYHRQNDNIDWTTLTAALKVKYKPDYNDFDILDDIRRRKQKQNETFDQYFDIISSYTDKLKTHISDRDLCETVHRNLRSDIRHELLHSNITSVSQLRTEVRKHEKFINDTLGTEHRRSNKAMLRK